jgi:adenine deaminase
VPPRPSQEPPTLARPSDVARLLAVARGDSPADLLLAGGHVVDVFTGEVRRADIAVAGRWIAGVGRYEAATRVVDLAGAFVAPGLIDAHVHVESSMVTPREFARAVVPRGVTTVVTDPHEIANVMGLEGVRFMLDDARQAPLSMFVNASSCVPATSMATSGATLGAAELAAMAEWDGVLGLAEVMNYPGALQGDPEVLAMIAAYAGRPIDGHSPGLTGRALCAYVAAGPRSDHEVTSAAEAAEKMSLGMYVFVREATNAHNLAAVIGALTPANSRRLCLCTDDRQPPDLLNEGSTDHLIRRAVAAGVEPVTALRLATLNPAEAFGLSDRGAIGPGRLADLVVADDLGDFRVRAVFRHGEEVAAGGHLVADVPAAGARRLGQVTVDWERVSLTVPPARGDLRVIGVVPDQLVTEHLLLPPAVSGAEVVADPARDIAKMAVIERHGRGGGVGLGFVQGLGIRRGAVAGTVAHDHHNLVVAGADDVSMMTAARAAARGGGGLAAALGTEVLATVPLPVAGLMSDRTAAEVAAELAALLAAARGLGSTLHDPFMALSFLGLEVIPHLKLTDRGLVDVDRFAPVPLFAAP